MFTNKRGSKTFEFKQKFTSSKSGSYGLSMK